MTFSTLLLSSCATALMYRRWALVLGVALLTWSCGGAPVAAPPDVPPLAVAPAEAGAGTDPAARLGRTKPAPLDATGQAWGSALHFSDPQIEGLFAPLCQRGDLMGCFFAGVVHEQQGRMEPASLLYDYACQHGLSIGCYNVGIFLREGRSVERDLARAAHHVAYGCARGEARSCGEVGMSYLEGRGLPRDPVQATAYLQRACDMSYQQSCNNLAQLFWDGNGVTIDRAEAARRFQSACQRGYGHACLRSAWAAAEAQRCGAGADASPTCLAAVREDLAGAFEQLCHESPSASACVSSGLMHEGFTYDPGLNVFRRTTPTAEQLEEAHAIYEAWCSKGAPLACNHLANLYRRGQGVEQDMERAMQLYRRACDGGFILACHDLAMSMLNGRLSDEILVAIELLKTSCKANVGDMCQPVHLLCRMPDAPRASCADVASLPH